MYLCIRDGAVTVTVTVSCHDIRLYLYCMCCSYIGVCVSVWLFGFFLSFFVICYVVVLNRMLSLPVFLVWVQLMSQLSGMIDKRRVYLQDSSDSDENSDFDD